VTKRDAGVAVVVGVVVGAFAAGYSRSGWTSGWQDSDHDCQDTRQEVLIEESVVPATLDAKGCRVLMGEWHDPYTGQTVSDPGALDVDHVVPLAWAHRHGGWAWSREQRERYANDLAHPEHLVAVSASANRSKGDKGPDEWLPLEEDRCDYVQAWRAIITRWDLMLTWAERDTLDALLASCQEWTRP